MIRLLESEGFDSPKYQAAAAREAKVGIALVVLVRTGRRDIAPTRRPRAQFAPLCPSIYEVSQTPFLFNSTFGTPAEIDQHVATLGVVRMWPLLATCTVCAWG